MLNTQVKDAGPKVTYARRAMETMGNRIKALREAKGLTQPQLGKLVGVTKSAISQWENGGTANIKLQPFLRLCQALGTDERYLVYGTSRAPSFPSDGAGRERRSAR